MHSIEQVALLLLVAVLLVPIFQRFKLGGVLGYLAAGVFIGPYALGVVSDAESTLHLAEFGIVLLLFLIGLELEPARLWALRRTLLALGGAQVAATGIVLAAICMAMGMRWQSAIAAALACAMSSTALVLASLNERGQLASPHGRDAFAILLFQDLAVIPLLALLPLLGATSPATGNNWSAAALGVAAIVVVVIASRIVVRPVLKFVARHGSRDVFTAAALLLVIGAATLTQKLGLSMGLGAFLAGVLLADSEFRHELEANIEPFKGLLLGLFFMAIGMGANLALLVEQPLQVVGLAVGLMFVKLLVMYAIARIAGAPNETAQRVAVLLCQGGEFAFVVFTAGGSLAVFDIPTMQLLTLAVTLSMLLAPGVILLHEHRLARWLERSAQPEFDRIDDPGSPVIIAGFGRFGQIVSRVLRMCDVKFTALDVNFQQVDFVRRYGSKVYYGDASRLELLHAAKAAEARLFVLAVDDVEASVRTAAMVRRHFPDLPILARARNRVHWFRLRDLGVTSIYRETFAASLAVAHQSLLRVGIGAAAAERAIALFKKHDEAQLVAQYAIHQDEPQLIQSVREAAEQLKELFEADATGPDVLRRNERS